MRFIRFNSSRQAKLRNDAEPIEADVSQVKSEIFNGDYFTTLDYTATGNDTQVSYKKKNFIGRKTKSSLEKL